jgi:retron-type reverse transcriptase
VDKTCLQRQNSTKVLDKSSLIEEILKQHPMKQILNLSKGDINLAKQRKGELTTLSEVRRQLLNSHPIGKLVAKLASSEVNLMNNNPKQYLNNYNALVRIKNNKLKFDMLTNSNYSRLINYKSDKVLRVLLPEAKGKIRFLGIPTLNDRYMQKLVTIILEPYLEPCGDESS